jgi:hypothetical protein
MPRSGLRTPAPRTSNSLLKTGHKLDQTHFSSRRTVDTATRRLCREQRTDLIARTPLRIYFSCTGDWMKPKVTRDKLAQLCRDPANWKRGLIYSCKDDPRIVVPKKQKWRGWTINFAHRRATPTLILMILASGLPVFLLAIFGLARTPIWWACLFLTMAIICLVCWYLSSPSRYV